MVVITTSSITTHVAVVETLIHGELLSIVRIVTHCRVSVAIHITRVTNYIISVDAIRVRVIGITRIIRIVGIMMWKKIGRAHV